MSPVKLYDAFAADYDRFVSWKGRLSHELPFFDRLFAEAGVRRVLDAACGTGHHAIALAQQGYRVAGADLSAAMVERATENALAAGVTGHLAVAGFGELASLGMTFDGVICLGNSLPHLLSALEVHEALADFAAVLRPGGLLVIQNRNFDRLWAARERFMPPQWHRDEDGTWIFCRFYDFHEATITFNMIRLRQAKDGWVQKVDSTELRPIFAGDLAAGLVGAGFPAVELFGGYDSSVFDPACSDDLIAVARRAG